MYIIKHNGTVFFGCVETPVPDSAGHDSGVPSCPDNSLIWEAPNDDGIMVMASCNNIVVDILKDDPAFFCGKITHEKLITETVPALKQLFARFGKLDDNGRMLCGFAVAQNDRAYLIKANTECEEVDEFDAYRWYDELALSTLVMTKGGEPDDRLRMIAHVLKTLFTDTMPIQVMNNKTFERYWVK